TVTASSIHIPLGVHTWVFVKACCFAGNRWILRSWRSSPSTSAGLAKRRCCAWSGWGAPAFEERPPNKRATSRSSSPLAEPDGRPGMQILLERSGIHGLPVALDGVPVSQRVTGRLMAFSDPTQRQRPAPSGFSVGHPAITAGTIGARVRDALGRVYILSNNHVLANSNGATIGDAEYQPGPFDGGTAADQIATLTDFQAINFAGGNNTIDAAIA